MPCRMPMLIVATDAVDRSVPAGQMPRQAASWKDASHVKLEVGDQLELCEERGEVTLVIRSSIT